MTIRPYEARDLDAVIRLSLRAWEPVFESIERAMDPDVYRELHPDWRIDQQNAVTAVCKEDVSQVWVAELHGAIAGFVAVRQHSSCLGEIYMIAVDPAFQRRGIGKALTEFALAWLARAGKTVAMVETGGDPGHAQARQTYEKCGFQLLPVARYFKKLHASATHPTPMATARAPIRAVIEDKFAPQRKRKMTAQSVVEVLDLADAVSVEVWLDGGWGIDALLGQQTRPHSDLDIILRLSDAPRLEAAFRAIGYVVKPGGSATNFVLTDGRSREVDLHAITFDDRGYGQFQLPDGKAWGFPPSAFRGDGEIEGRKVRCLSPEAQVQCHGQGYAPTEKDLSDMERLQARFEVVLPLHLWRPIV